MTHVPWIGVAALIAMFVIPHLPSWIFEGPRTVKHWPRRHVCGVCNAVWIEGHTCPPVGPVGGSLGGEVWRVAPPGHLDRPALPALPPRRRMLGRGR